jgi:serine phosphatase RsbU (regulator of sigma subunit)
MKTAPFYFLWFLFSTLGTSITLVGSETHKTVDSLIREAGKNYNADPGTSLSLARKAELLLADDTLNASFVRVNYAKGVSEFYIGNFALSLKHFNRAIQLSKQIKNDTLLAQSQSGISNVYNNLREFDLAIFHLKSAISLYSKLQIHHRLGGAWGNLGNTYLVKGVMDSSEYCYEKAFEYWKEAGDSNGISNYYTSKAEFEHKKKNLTAAAAYYKKAIELKVRLGQRLDVAGLMGNLSNVYFDEKKFEEAVRILKEATAIGYEAGGLELTMDLEKKLHENYEQLGRHSEAMFHLQKYYAIRDTLYSLENQKQLAHIRTEFETERKELEIQKLKAQNDRQTLLGYFLGTAVIMITLIGIILYNRYRIKKNANRILQEKNGIISEAYRDIQDSIQYSIRIQKSMVSSDEELRQIFPESLFINMPRDLVSGDFFWMWHNQDSQETWVAVADCTGHGVPGALMSMIGVSQLNQIIKSERVEDPGLALIEMNRRINIALRQGDQDSNNDGMDLLLLKIQHRYGKAGFSGANRNLWVSNPSGSDIGQIPGNKFSVGGNSEMEKAFKTNTLDLKAHSRLYLFSDGFADQFGGPEGKKIMTRRLRDWILQSNATPMKDAENMLRTQFLKWKGNNLQVDDVLVVGIQYEPIA